MGGVAVPVGVMENMFKNRFADKLTCEMRPMTALDGADTSALVLGSCCATGSDEKNGRRRRSRS